MRVAESCGSRRRATSSRSGSGRRAPSTTRRARASLCIVARRCRPARPRAAPRPLVLEPVGASGLPVNASSPASSASSCPPPRGARQVEAESGGGGASSARCTAVVRITPASRARRVGERVERGVEHVGAKALDDRVRAVSRTRPRRRRLEPRSAVLAGVDARRVAQRRERPRARSTSIDAVLARTVAPCARSASRDEPLDVHARADRARAPPRARWRPRRA